jgi:hypothetical protein
MTFLVDETQNHPDNFAIAENAEPPTVITDASDQELLDAIDRTSSEVCEGLDAAQELGKDEGVNMNEQQDQIRAALVRQLTGLGL